VILASSSPQRKAILEQLGIAFRVVVPEVDELVSGPPDELVVENARRKAGAVAEAIRREATAPATGLVASGRATPVLGVDTVVVVDSEVYGKPADEVQARATLTLLAGREHQVLSGLCVIDGDHELTAVDVTQVTFRPYDRTTLDWYLATDEWRGRAGGYAIQGRGAALVQRIDGDYLNVVGLPVATLLDLYPSALFTCIS